MLTLKQLKDLKPGIFLKGEIVDSPEGINMINSGKLLKWVAVRGMIEDWAIYVGYDNEMSFDQVRDYGDKVRFEKNIKKLVPCDKEAFAMYRY